MGSRKHIQNHTTTRQIKLEDFPDGKMLKVNRRNNSRHYRVYQTDESVRFELKLKDLHNHPTHFLPHQKT